MHSFLADTADWQKKVNSVKTGWTGFKIGSIGFHQTEFLFSDRLSWWVDRSQNWLSWSKTGWAGFWIPTRNQLSQYLNTSWTSLKTSWTSIFQRAILAKINFKRLYYILSLRINKGKIEVLDQGFWVLVPTPTFFLDPPNSTMIPILKLNKI